MAGSKTDAFEQRILNLVFKGTGTSLTALANNWIALFTVVPSDSSNGTEVSGLGYIRKQTAPSDWTLSGSQITNATEQAFNAATGPYSIVGWGIFDAASGGNLLYWGDTTLTNLVTGDIARFAPLSITINED